MLGGDRRRRQRHPGAGQLNLRDETLDLRATVRPRDFSPLSLRAPITVTGTLGQPKLGVDGQKLAGKVLKAQADAAASGSRQAKPVAPMPAR